MIHRRLTLINHRRPRQRHVVEVLRLKLTGARTAATTTGRRQLPADLGHGADRVVVVLHPHRMTPRRQHHRRRIRRRRLILPPINHLRPIHKHPNPVITRRRERRRPRSKRKRPIPRHRKPIRIHTSSRTRRTPIMIHRRLTLINHRRPRQRHVVEVLRLKLTSSTTRTTAAGVADSVNRPALEVGVEDVPARARFEVDRVRRAADQQLRSQPDPGGRSSRQASPRCSFECGRRRSARRRREPDTCPRRRTQCRSPTTRSRSGSRRRTRRRCRAST